MKFAAAAAPVRAVVVAEGSHRRCHWNRGRERDRELAVGERIGAAVLREAIAAVPAAVQPQLAPPKLLPSPSSRKLTGVAGGYRRSIWFYFESHNRVRGRRRPYLKLAVGERIGAAVLHEAIAAVPAAVQPRLAPPKLLPSPSSRKLTGVAGGYRRSIWFYFESHNRVRGRRRPYLNPLSSWVLVVASYSAIRCCWNQARFTGQMHRSLIMFFAAPSFCFL
ncbi:uncharacterized protein LOC107644504 isoform X2 [Arachis ipaensis]|uniref:uncharacterized protein LOC107644504 isoform X2 n=1 Tax=Arachis ipaensis TaxID=130454 RepID=UPI000A2B9369|nr:uncharacterized protein LOC107644504 isoform X2 [Arachis ipaensis]